MLKLLFTSRAGLVAAGAGIGTAVGFYVWLTPDTTAPGLIATVAAAVFAVTAGAGIPLLYSIADRRLEYWRDQAYGGGDTTGASQDLSDLVVSLRVVVLGVACLLLATVLSLGVAYESSVASTGPRAILAASFGLLVAGLLLTMTFAVSAARIDVIGRLAPILSSSIRPAAPAAATPSAIDALVGAATPHFALQLRARIDELVRELPVDDPVRRYGEGWMAFLERLAHTSSKDGVRH